MVRKSLSLAATLLAAFHLWIFADQVWGGELVDLALVSRWIIAAGLIAALVNLRRRSLSLVRGRHAVSVWLLAALLHGPALARGADGVAPSMPGVVATLAQAMTGIAVAGTALLVLLALRLRGAGVPALKALASLDAPLFVGALPPHSFLAFAPRPPPTTPVHR